MSPRGWGRVFAYTAPVDLRRGFDGLSALVRSKLGSEPTSGSAYLFVNRRRYLAKVLLWDGTGMVIYAKRLEEGRFAPLWRRSEADQLEMSSAELELYLEGCQEVARRRLSPRKVDPNRTLLSLQRSL